MNYLGLSFLSIILFGLELVLSKLATGHLPPESIALTRTVAAAIVITVYVAVRRPAFPLNQFTGYAAIAGICLGIGFLFMLTALSTGPTSVVAPLIGLSMLIPTLVGILVWQEAFTLTKALGILCASIAIILISQ
jgi:transporter family protein